MPNIKLVIEYDGSAFHGWQTQPGEVRTIQGELHRVLETVLREKIKVVQASGRTDAGVHAKAQVVAFKVEEQPDLLRLTHSVSSLFKGELSVVSAEIVPDSFHPIRDAERKQYSYRILNRAAPAVLKKGQVWHISEPLNVELMNREAKSLIGVHDFTSFMAAGCEALSTVKEIFESEVVRDGDIVIYRVVGKGFLKQMVRIIVGTLVDISRARIVGHTMREIVELKDRKAAGITAPAHGLSLDFVLYR
jgi:tRNA pseudouridine38-40 synthase